jgi:hypothetical protein
MFCKSMSMLAAGNDAHVVVARIEPSRAILNQDPPHPIGEVGD